MKQKEIEKKGNSGSTLNCYKNDIKCGVLINQTIPKDLQRLQMTSDVNENDKPVSKRSNQRKI